MHNVNYFVFILHPLPIALGLSNGFELDLHPPRDQKCLLNCCNPCFYCCNTLYAPSRRDLVKRLNFLNPLLELLHAFAEFFGILNCQWYLSIAVNRGISEPYPLHINLSSKFDIFHSSRKVHEQENNSCSAANSDECQDGEQQLLHHFFFLSLIEYRTIDENMSAIILLPSIVSGQTSFQTTMTTASAVSHQAKLLRFSFISSLKIIPA